MKSLIAMMALVAVAGGSIAACATARTPEAYRDATYAVLESRNSAVKSCYDDALKGEDKVSGKVVVQFTVDNKTGAITDPKVDEAASTAPASLGQCVVKALDGLTIDPPDANVGNATFTWDFSS